MEVCREGGAAVGLLLVRAELGARAPAPGAKRAGPAGLPAGEPPLSWVCGPSPWQISALRRVYSVVRGLGVTPGAQAGRPRCPLGPRLHRVREDGVGSEVLSTLYHAEAIFFFLISQ